MICATKITMSLLQYLHLLPLNQMWAHTHTTQSVALVVSDSYTYEIIMILASPGTIGLTGVFDLAGLDFEV